MRRLIQWSIDHHWIVIAMSVLLAACGLWVARDMPVDVFPDLTAPTVTILTEGRGMAPEEMESLVTFPIEAAINGASGVRRVRSATALGIATLVLAAAYSLPPLRLKARGAAGLWAAAAAQRTLPVLLAFAVLGPLNAEAWAFASVAQLAGLRWMVVHQLGVRSLPHLWTSLGSMPSDLA